MAVAMNLYTWLVIISSLTIFSSLATNKKNLQLENVHILFRHGDRTPVIELPKLTGFRKKDWPEGLGMLTRVGILQQFHLGRFLRRHYDELVGSRYYKDEIWIRSTDYERTLMSAEAVLAGVYYVEPNQTTTQSNKSEIWHPHIRWWPAPVHTVPQLTEDLLIPNTCPKYHKFRAKLITQMTSTLNESDMNFLRDVHKRVGLNKGTISLSSLDSIYDHFFCAKAHNHTYPSWLTKSYEQQLERLASEYWSSLYSSVNLLRFRSGLLVHTILDNLKAITAGKRPKIHSNRLIMLSAHDTTVLALINILSGKPHHPQPPYTSCIMLELYSDNNKAAKKSWFIKLRYRNSSRTDADVFNIPIGKCSNLLCPYEEFTKLLSKSAFSADQMRKKCGTPSSQQVGIRDSNKTRGDSHNSTDAFLIALWVVSAILGLVFIGVMFRLCAKQSNAPSEPVQYSRLPQSEL